LVPPHGSLPVLDILDFDYFGAEVEEKALFVLLLVGEVLDFFLPY
jgi:hypothetical protein